ncbi:uncharacterized protein BDZ99DRAFT_575639 [Mytilinidion resinicola]|uniref:Secreted protein n=1 Tax=Mytilinidion resinicola TaxID=574789 RepID=A0A6A6Y619_9PEZI|nr:uncharacterized protein BDZ99DRAFT_575639 [Mytilinidion resinicola]KAF2803973.1 hypothetical protein BDZ99DRAFT_575639 [Mytilinidion resinicola]
MNAMSYALLVIVPSSLVVAAGWPTAVAPLGALKLNGQRFGFVLTSPPQTEHLLLHFLIAYEATFPSRAQPLPLHTVPLMSPDEEMLPDKPMVDMISHEWHTRRFSCFADALADWLNARWRKYENPPLVSRKCSPSALL